MFPIKILEEGAIIGHLFSIYQAGQFGLKSRWVVLYPWKNVSSFLFSGHLPLRKLARNFCRSWPELSWARTLAREFPLPKRFPRVQIQFQWENTDLDSSRQRTSSILKGGREGQEIGVCVLEEGTRYLDDVSPRDVHRESMSSSSVYRKDKADNCSRVKILEHIYCSIHVEDRGVNFAWEMELETWRLKYHFLVRKLRWLVCKFHGILFGYKNDSFESKSIECFERYNRENTFFHLIELRDRERERENSIYKYARERKKFEHSIRISIIR